MSSDFVGSDRAGFETFLCFLSYNGNLTVSAEHAGLSLREVRARQSTEPEFAQNMTDALESAADRLRFKAWQRAVHGEDVPYFYQGEQVGTKRRPSDQLMAQLLRASDNQTDLTDDKEDSRVQLARRLAEKLARLSEEDDGGDASQAD